MPPRKTIVTSLGEFDGLRSFAEYLGMKPENIKARVRAGRAEELISGVHKGYDPARLGFADLRIAKGSIAKRIAAHARALEIVKEHPRASLLTTEAEHVYAQPGEREHLLINCGVDGHPIWRAHLEVLARGGWCGHCSDSVLKTDAQVRAAIEDREWTWVDGVYVNANTPLLLRCQDGHEFRMSLSKLLNSAQWCPACHGSREESIVRHYLEQGLGIGFDQIRTRPDWLVDERGQRLELDGLNVLNAVAFEYQGEHHYKNVSYGGTRRLDAEEVKRRDRRKLELASERGIALVVVPMLPRDWSDAVAREHVLAALASHFPERRAEFSLRIAASPAFIRKEPEKLEWFRDQCAERGLVLNEATWHGYHGSHSVTCPKGHTWSATPATLLRKRHAGMKDFQGHGCPTCGRERTVAAVSLAKQRQFEARSHQCFEELKALAEAGGQTLREDRYHGSQKKHLVECRTCGHLWHATPYGLKKGHGCPHCWEQRRNVMFKASAGRKGSMRQERVDRAVDMYRAGASMEQVATTLGVSVATAKHYRAHAKLPRDSSSAGAPQAGAAG